MRAEERPANIRRRGRIRVGGPESRQETRGRQEERGRNGLEFLQEGRIKRRKGRILETGSKPISQRLRALETRRNQICKVLGFALKTSSTTDNTDPELITGIKTDSNFTQIKKSRKFK
jgi:hypothetical protein